MADKKISALTAASTPLAGTEVLPIVQSGATVKVAVSDLTAGRAISATQITLTAGNVIPANGYGVDFSATPGTGTSELLDDYEEGTWTPVLTAGVPFTSVTYLEQTGSYTKVGRLVTVRGTIFTSAVVVGLAAGDVIISGLPFANSEDASIAGCVADTRFWTNNPSEIEVRGLSSNLLPRYKTTADGGSSSIAAGTVAIGALGNLMHFSCSYNAT